MALEHKINAGDDDYVSDCTKWMHTEQHLKRF